jgi:hypothetical protein
MAILAAYGVAVAIASVAAGLRGGPQTIPLLPAAFATMHVAYGAGFLAGLATIASRKLANGEQTGPPVEGFEAYRQE